MNWNADAIPRFTVRRDRLASSEEEDMDMTPMINVAFQLLLFFMIISAFQVQKPIGVPDPGDPKQAKNIPTLGQLGSDRVVVSVNANNEFELVHYDHSGNVIRSEAVNRDELAPRLQQVSRQKRKSAVIIRADDKAKHESVVSIIDAANLANMEDIRIAQPVTAGHGGDRESSSVPLAPNRAVAPRKNEDK